MLIRWCACRPWCRDFMQAMRDRVRSDWPPRGGPQLWAAEAALIEPTGITDPAWATRRWEDGLAREREHLEAICDTLPTSVPRRCEDDMTVIVARIPPDRPS